MDTWCKEEQEKDDNEEYENEGARKDGVWTKNFLQNESESAKVATKSQW